MTHRLPSAALLFTVALMLCACSTGYKAKPLPFKAPGAYNNAVSLNGAQIGARAFVDSKDAQNAFGFDVRGAGMLPVQIAFDNQSPQTLEINPAQTFLEDSEGNLWPILTDQFAYERTTKYAQTNQMFKEGAYSGFLGATAGALVGAAVGIVTGEDVLRRAGEGAVIGGAGGAVLGGVSGGTSNEARSRIVRDLRDKSLENKSIAPGALAHGILFFPGEAQSAKKLRLQLRERDSGMIHTLFLSF
jgi:hypothetical protein